MKKKLLYILIMLVLCTVFTGCIKSIDTMTNEGYTSPKKTGTITATYEHNGVTREYILYIPEDLPEDSALVIGMHGYTSSPWTFKDNFGWDKVADENKFIMCYPQGANEVYNDYSHWNARLTLSTVDDVGFISELALHLAEEYKLDKDTIFATGFSNGGYMAYTLACERPDVFRAVASVSGLMSGYTWQSYNPYDLEADKWLELSPSTPVPVCHIHGTGDLIVPIDGSVYLPAFAGGPSAEKMVRFWAGINNCSEVEVVQVSKNVEATRYINPDSNSQVWYYEYDGWNHYWPSEDYIVDKPSEINAQEIIWEFFSIYIS